VSHNRFPDLAEVRFFVDEDLSGVGLGLMRLRNDVVVGGHEPVREFVPVGTRTGFRSSPTEAG
jgi:hypothetical protein